ncbi:hypothetical protein [Winogradskyella ursingii]|uniref:hypothetical protein n=1 Tax=Winogradskyella ursingii TaxID=2686079 RepID=UPI0015CEB791|nr:hypothetical protein [Winogradskyella ursingii]
MQKILLLLLFSSCFLFAQKSIRVTAIDSTELKVATIFGIDNFETLYYTTEDNTFYKKTKDTTITYTNFQLGGVTTANIFNPLKINLFYQDFNTVIILDNRLAEIFKVDFNTLQPYKNISHVSTGFDNTLWLFNQDLQVLELYDYKANKTRLKTVPVQAKVLDLKSDYNYCYLLTENYLYIYNYFGSLINKYENKNYITMAFSKGHLMLKKDNLLFILHKNEDEILPVKLPDLLINQFLVTDETLYIYDDKYLRRYQLKKD